MQKENQFHYHEQLRLIQEDPGKQQIKQNRANKPFFEGWYYKCKSREVGNLAIIFGVSSSKEEQQCFIQLVHHSDIKGYYSFPITAFSVTDEPFMVKIGDSVFQKTEAVVSLPHVYLRLRFDDIEPLPSTTIHPSIMGPLLYLKHLPCYHHIIGLRSKVWGAMSVKKDDVWSSEQLFDGMGYLEKDYGVSFPTGYTWCHAVNEDAMMVVAVAMVPYVKKDRVGFFAVLKKGDQIFRFSTYQVGKVKRLSHYQSKIYIEIEQFLTQLSIHIEYQESCQLRAPKQGKMNEFVEESLDCRVHVLVEKHGKTLFEEIFEEGTSEIYEYAKMCFKQT